MTTNRSPLIVGNWKMNGSLAGAASLVNGIARAISDSGVTTDGQCALAICPPYPYLYPVAQALRDDLGSTLGLGAQNVAAEESSGAFTGEISADMLADVGCQYVILGHSERRTLYDETSDIVAQKHRVVVDAGLNPILCVGETIEQRESGETEGVIKEQLDAVLSMTSPEDLQNTVVAYEPVWAIGTGLSATPEQAQEVHVFIRNYISAKGKGFEHLAMGMKILYGGSMKPSNAVALLACPDIDGGLIGGASLNASDFVGIAVAAV